MTEQEGVVGRYQHEATAMLEPLKSIVTPENKKLVLQIFNHLQVMNAAVQRLDVLFDGPNGSDITYLEGV